MSTVEKLIGGLIALTALAVILKDGGRSANTVLGGLADFNTKTFGTFLRS